MKMMMAVLPLLAACGDSNPADDSPCGTCAENAHCIETLEGLDCQCKEGYFGSGKVKCTKRDDPGNCPAIPAPTTPTSPSPQDGAADRSVTSVTLRWEEPAKEYKQYDKALGSAPSSCWDTGRDKTTKYDIYFGTAANPPLLKKDVPSQRGGSPDGSQVCLSLTEQSGTWLQRTSFKVTSALKYGATYYWKIVVRNRDGLSAKGPVWSFSTNADIRCAAAPTVKDQDGNSYDTVQIGSQCWLNRNLAVGTLKTGSQPDNGVIEKNCYKSENQPDCTGFYSWNELMNHTQAGSICPAGWHVPTVAEWKLLINHVDFKNFNPQYQGFKGTSNISYGSLGGYYWTSDEKSAGPDGIAEVVIFYHSSKNKSPGLSTYNKGSNLLSARCVK
jgi:hypothetical protein